MQVVELATGRVIWRSSQRYEDAGNPIEPAWQEAVYSKVRGDFHEAAAAAEEMTWRRADALSPCRLIGHQVPVTPRRNAKKSAAGEWCPAADCRGWDQVQSAVFGVRMLPSVFDAPELLAAASTHL
jgi:hypothetical protein